MSDFPRVPKFITPQVPILTAEPPEGLGWIHEIKHDGFRTLLRIDRGDIRAFTRGGHDWSDKYGRVIDACRKLKCGSTLIDGEVLIQDKDGLSDFAALRAAIAFYQCSVHRGNRGGDTHHSPI